MWSWEWPVLHFTLQHSLFFICHSTLPPTFLMTCLISSTSLHIAWSKHNKGCFVEGLRNIESKWCFFVEWVAFGAVSFQMLQLFFVEWVSFGAVSFKMLQLFMVDRPAKFNLLENILHEHNIPSHYMKLTPCHINYAKKGLLLTSLWPIATIKPVLYYQPYQY